MAKPYFNRHIATILSPITLSFLSRYAPNFPLGLFLEVLNSVKMKELRWLCHCLYVIRGQLSSCPQRFMFRIVEKRKEESDSWQINRVYFWPDPGLTNKLSVKNTNYLIQIQFFWWLLQHSINPLTSSYIILSPPQDVKRFIDHFPTYLFGITVKIN